MRTLNKKNAVSLLALSLMMSVGLNAAMPRRANAAAGLVTGTPWVAVAGGVIFVAGLAAGNDHPQREGRAGGVIAMLIGVLILESERGAAPHYLPVTDEQAFGLRMSSAQAHAYNENIDEINSIAETVTRELGRMKEPTVEAARRMWLEVGAESGIEMDALQGMSKVSAAATAAE